jgi:TolA-binding protein
MISAEEVSQEVLQAVITKDFGRLQALWITDAELDSLGLPDAEAARIRKLKDNAQAKFQKTCAALTGLGEQTQWNHLDAPAPQCIPAGTNGLKQDLIKQTHASILYQNGPGAKQIDTLQMGEMIQVGQAWRLLDVPGDVIKDGGGPDGARVTPEMQKLLDQLTAMEQAAPKAQTTVGSNPAVVEYNLRRAAVLQQVIDLLDQQQDQRHQDQWIRQLADCYSEAAQTSSDTDKSAYENLVQLEAKTVQKYPGSPLAAYVTFREMSADYATKLANAGPNSAKVQEERVARLTKFIEDYPQAEDAADALMQLAMISEFNGKEIEAKKWYERLHTQFPKAGILHDKAQGALRRLDLEGKEIELAGPKLAGGNFDIHDLRGKLVIVYYWASWNQQCVGDFARLRLLLSNYATKGLELVCVNLDNAPPEADTLTSRLQAPGVQLYQPGGLDSPLATQYGVMVLPNMFFVGRDGKVLSRTVQIATIEDEIKKQLK